MPPRLPDICHCYMVWLSLVSWHGNICLTKRRRHLFFRRIQVDFVVLYHKALNTAWTEKWFRLSVSRLDQGEWMDWRGLLDEWRIQNLIKEQSENPPSKLRTESINVWTECQNGRSVQNIDRQNRIEWPLELYELTKCQYNKLDKRIEWSQTMKRLND